MKALKGQDRMKNSLEFNVSHKQILRNTEAPEDENKVPPNHLAWVTPGSSDNSNPTTVRVNLARIHITFNLLSSSMVEPNVPLDIGPNGREDDDFTLWNESILNTPTSLGAPGF